MGSSSSSSSSDGRDPPCVKLAARGGKRRLSRPLQMIRKVSYQEAQYAACLSAHAWRKPRPPYCRGKWEKRTASGGSGASAKAPDSAKAAAYSGIVFFAKAEVNAGDNTCRKTL